MKQDTRTILLILLVLLTGGLAVRTCSLERKADELNLEIARARSPKPSSSIVPFVLPPRPSADPAEEADLKHHQAAIARCSAEKRLAVIGYGWKIVCIDPKFVAWSEGPLTGHDPGGL